MSSPSAPALSILVVAYNSADCIAECLRAIPLACTNYAYEVLLIDNGDGQTETLVADRFPEVALIESRGNIGFAAGNNLLAANASSDFLVLLNPDMVLERSAIDALMVGAKTHSSAAAWGGVSLGKNKKPDTGNAIAIPTLGELARVALGRSGVGNRPVEGLVCDAKVDVLMGGFVMFSRAAWNQSGGLDERFFLYCEEVDLFYRLKTKGHTFWRIAKARGVHDAAHGNAFSPMRQLYRVSGIVEFTRHHWPRWQVVLGIALIWWAAMTRWIAGKTLGGTRERLKHLGLSNRLIATRPRLWIYGYDPERGLMAQHVSGETELE